MLFVVATPIGHLQDISQRALEVLAKADLIFCEDTRQTLKLLNHYGLKKSLVSAHSHNERSREPMLVEALRQGKSAALVSDAGTPGISDPGSRLVARAVQEGFRVVPVPGPSAVMAALAASGLSTDGFVFLGFPSRRLGRLCREVQKACGLGKTVIFLESPFRLKKTLQALQEFWKGPVVIARELTKIHEEFIRGPLSEVVEQLQKREIKGEVVVLLGELPA